MTKVESHNAPERTSTFRGEYWEPRLWKNEMYSQGWEESSAGFREVGHAKDIVPFAPAFGRSGQPPKNPRFSFSICPLDNVPERTCRFKNAGNDSFPPWKCCSFIKL
jgi:hypothetical protein